MTRIPLGPLEAHAPNAPSQAPLGGAAAARLAARPDLCEQIFAQVQDDGDLSQLRLSSRGFCQDVDRVQPQRQRRDAALALDDDFGGAQASRTRLLERVQTLEVAPRRPGANGRQTAHLAWALQARDDFRRVALGHFSLWGSPGNWLELVGSGLAKQQRLEAVDLRGPAFVNAHAARHLALTCLNQAPLRELYLPAVPLGGLAQKLPLWPLLQSLAVSCPPGDPHLPELLTALQGRDQLGQLCLREGQLTPPNWRALLLLVQHNAAIRRLHIAAPVKAGAHGTSQVAPEANSLAPRLNHLTHLVLNCDDESHLPDLVDLFDASEQLRALSASCRDDDVAAKTLLQALAGRAPKLQQLRLRLDVCADATYGQLRAAWADKAQLAQVEIFVQSWGYGDTDAAMPALFASLAQLPSLTTLRLRRDFDNRAAPWRMGSRAARASRAPLTPFLRLHTLVLEGDGRSSSQAWHLRQLLAAMPALRQLQVTQALMQQALPQGVPAGVTHYGAHLDWEDRAADLCAYVNKSPQVQTLELHGGAWRLAPGASRHTKPTLQHVQHLMFARGYNFAAPLPFYAPRLRTLRLTPAVNLGELTPSVVGNLMNLVMHAPLLQQIVIESHLSAPMSGLAEFRRALGRARGHQVAVKSVLVDPDADCKTCPSGR